MPPPAGCRAKASRRWICPISRPSSTAASRFRPPPCAGSTRRSDRSASSRRRSSPPTVWPKQHCSSPPPPAASRRRSSTSTAPSSTTTASWRCAEDSPNAVAQASAGKIGVAEWATIVDSDTATELPDDQIGEIWIHGQNMGTGYWGKPEETYRDLPEHPEVADRALARRGCRR